MKKIQLFLLLCFCVLAAHAQTFFNVDGIRYMIEDDHAVIARQDQELSGEVIIPATVTCGETDYNVTRMISPNECDDNGAFQECQITGITLPTSITEIPPFAFYRCNSLSSVTIPQNVTTIGYVAFAECSKLSSFNVAEGNSYYSSENGVLFNKNKTILLQYPQAKSETSYIIPNSVTSITYIAFSGCSNLTSVTIPNSMKNIGEYAFRNCSGLTSITIPKSVTSLGNSAFEGCSGLVEVSIGSNVQTFNSSVFKGCQNLSEVWCYATVVPTVESDAFAESNYTNATLYVRNTILEEFRNAEPWNSFSEIRDISSLQDYAPYHTIFNADGIRYMTEDDEVVIARQDRELTGDIVIPATVTYGETEYPVTRLMSPEDSESGGGGAFQECEITSISLPASITDIPDFTFYQCKQLSSVTLQGPVTHIGESSFSHCEVLGTIDLPDAVTEIERFAFQGSGLTEFKVPQGVTVLEEIVCADTKITNIEIPATVIELKGSCFGNWETESLPVKKTIKMYQRDCRAIETHVSAFGDMTQIDLLVPAGGKVVYQEYYPWSNMNSITEYGENTGPVLVPDQRHVTIDGIRYMLKDGEAYVDIQPATLSGEVVVPEAVTYESVDYPVTTVMDAYDVCFSGAFSDTQVTKVTLPSSIKKIGWNAFRGAQSLQEVVLNEGITEIVEGSFMECPELTTINIPTTMAVLPKCTFTNCPKLKNLTLHEGLTQLEEESLYGTGIETLTIPSTCTKFGSCSLYLPNLKTLIIKVKEPTDIINAGRDQYHTETMNCAVFADYFLPNYEVVREFLSKVDLIVPRGCAENYKVQDPWFYCSSITEEEGGDYYQPKTIGVNIDGINYILKENTVEGQDEPVRTATIGQQKISLSGDIVIPEKVSYAKKVLQGDEWVTLEACDYDVTDIFTSILNNFEDDRGYSSGAGAFQECAITSISLPATITTIPTKTFYGCQQLKSVTLPEGITAIRAGAFANCSSLEEIYLPETITYMGGDYIFRNCTSLKKVNIPKQVTSLSSVCFANSGIETFIIPKNITNIGWGCFADTHLKNIKICHDSYSDGSISFPEGIFNDISGITLIVPEGTKESLYSQVYPWKDFENIIEYSDQHDEHQYNSYRVEYEEVADGDDDTPAEGRGRQRKTSPVNETVTASFTPSGIAPELPTEIERDGRKYRVTFKEPLATVMPGEDLVLKVVLTPALVMGDANGDGEVNVSDIVEIVNDIMGKTSAKFVRDAADMNNDGEINVTDIVKVVSIIMSANNSARVKTALLENTDNDVLALTENNDGLLSLQLNNAGGYMASQFDVWLSGGTTLEGMILNNGRSSGHLLTYSEIGDNLYRVVIYSPENHPYVGNEGELLKMKTSGIGDVEIDNILFITESQAEKRFSPLRASTTGIQTVEAASESTDVYSLDGKLVSTDGNLQQLPKGVYIINKKKVIVK